jgi:hypothetical protein
MSVIDHFNEIKGEFLIRAVSFIRMSLFVVGTLLVITGKWRDGTPTGAAR